MIRIQDSDALIVVDLQNDFLPGGALAVPDGDAVIAPLNEYLGRFSDARRPIFATRDWHPQDHCSFAAQGGPWPVHCLANTEGAAFADALQLPTDAQVVSKATDEDKEAYSGFDGTNLAESLRRHGATRVFIGGLATDYCVLATVKDALAAGFETLVLLDACRAVEVERGDGARAIEEMQSAGAAAITLAELA